MANYYASARSNYFRVKDREQFVEALHGLPVSVVDSTKHEGAVCLLGADPDGAGWPAWGYDESISEEFEVNLPQLIAAHLAEGEIAILMEAGAEKLRYVMGEAVAVNSHGETRSLTLHSIYELAQELTDAPERITACQY
jgi:hypothetical protein